MTLEEIKERHQNKYWFVDRIDWEMVKKEEEKRKTQPCLSIGWSDWLCEIYEN